MESIDTIDVADVRATRQRLAADPHRPLYHFLPPSNWMNDPNGLIQWKGQYHLFYQYNPGGALWGNIHWGHAVSTDLVHWRDLPVALAPTPGTADAGGCWSGCAFDHDGTPTILYTGGNPDAQLPCLAVSYDDLLSFEKHPGNPVIAAPPAHLNLVGFRDHSVWQEGEVWYQLVGAGVRGEGGAALLYRSPDLTNWEYLGPLYARPSSEREPYWSGEMWECVNFFSLDGQHVLVASVFAEDPVQFYYPVYFVGEYADGRFTPQHMGLLDLGGHVALGQTPTDDPGRQRRVGMRGGHCYAPQTFLDERGRRIFVGWLMEGLTDEAQTAAGWSGVVSLPRVLSLADDGTLLMVPVPELQSLRGQHVRLSQLPLVAGESDTLTEVAGNCLELLAEFAPDEAEQVGLMICRAPDGSEQTVVRYDRERGQLEVDGTHSSLDPNVQREVRGGPLALAEGEPLRLQVFIDRSVIEVFANGRACLSTRIYPTRRDSLGVRLFASGAGATLTSLDAWQLKPIWGTTGL